MFDFNFYEDCTYSSPNNSFLLDFMPAIISFLTIFVIIYVVFLSKQTEIQYDKFKRLCLDVVEGKLEDIQKYILNLTNLGSVELQEITSKFSDLNILYIGIRKIYPKIDIDSLQDKTFEYTDLIYSKKSLDFTKIKIYETRLIIINDLYNYALYDELNPLQKIFMRN